MAPGARVLRGGRDLTITPSLEEDIPGLLQSFRGINRQQEFVLIFWKIFVELFGYEKAGIF